MKKNPDEIEYKPSQIINIKAVRAAKLNKEKFPIFAINSYSIHGEEAIVGNPQNFTDDEILKLMNPLKPEDVDKSDLKLKEVKMEVAELKKPEQSSKELLVNNKTAEANVSVKHISYSKPNIPPISKETTLLRHKIMLVDEKSEPVVSSENSYPLATLNTFTKDVCIFIRVMNKGEVKSFTSNRGQGCLFTFIIMD